MVQTSGSRQKVRCSVHSERWWNSGRPWTHLRFRERDLHFNLDHLRDVDYTLVVKERGVYQGRSPVGQSGQSHSWMTHVSVHESHTMSGKQNGRIIGKGNKTVFERLRIGR